LPHYLCGVRPIYSDVVGDQRILSDSDTLLAKQTHVPDVPGLDAAFPISGLVLGPALMDATTYNHNDGRNMAGAINKNIPADFVQSDPALYEWAFEYVLAEFNGEVDALGEGCTEIGFVRTIDEVIAHAKVKDAAKSKRYQHAYNQVLQGHESFDISPMHRGKYQIKPEVLKSGASPRGILNPEPIAVLCALQVVLALESFVKRLRPTFKGYDALDKHIPIQLAVEAVGSTLFVARDCTARDGHTNDMAYAVFASILCKLLCLTCECWEMRAFVRCGMRANTPMGQLVSKLMRLYSGLGFTSIMNYITTRCDSFIIAKSLRLRRVDWAEVPEGDDGAMILSPAAFAAFRTAYPCERALAMFGRKLGKSWKLEAMGDLLTSPLPIVGGVVVCHDDKWYFFPSLTRFGFKAGRMHICNFGDVGQVRGRISGRCQALRHRFAALPVYEAYASCVTRSLGRLATARPTYDRDDEWTVTERRRSGKITDSVRAAFERAFGMSPEQQREIEREFDATNGSPDLRHWWAQQLAIAGDHMVAIGVPII